MTVDVDSNSEEAMQYTEMVANAIRRYLRIAGRAVGHRSDMIASVGQPRRVFAELYVAFSWCLCVRSTSSIADRIC
jgi:hypothetical protein